MKEPELAFVSSQRVARLATIAVDGTPSLVPVCFALIGSDEPAIVSVLDDKPKSVPDEELARVRHIRREPRVSVIVDRYDEDWSRLAFVQIRGIGRLVGPDDPLHATAIAALRSKYPQYHAMAIEQRPVMVIESCRVTSWGMVPTPSSAPR
jgi:PPOX class probable F420-dependent enzyme